MAPCVFVSESAQLQENLIRVNCQVRTVPAKGDICFPGFLRENYDSAAVSKLLSAWGMTLGAGYGGEAMPKLPLQQIKAVNALYC